METMAGQLRGVTGLNAAAENGAIAEMAVRDAGKLCRKVVAAVAELAKGRPPEPSPKEAFPKRFHKRVETIWRALWHCGKYQPDTILLYTHVIGKLVEWADRMDILDLTDADVHHFLDFYVTEGRPRAEKRLKTWHDQDGLGVRYVAFYAIRAVLDRLCNMNVTGGLGPPPRPAPADPASFAACCRLFGETRSDREQLLLLLTNGVGLMPSESAALSWSDFEQGFGAVKVQRREKAVTVEISDRLAPLLAQCRQRDPKRTYVFESLRSVDVVPVGVRALQHLLAGMVTRAGLSERITLTSLRKAPVYVPGMKLPRGSRLGPAQGPGSPEDPACPAPPFEIPPDTQVCADIDAVESETTECARLRKQLMSVHDSDDQSPDVDESAVKQMQGIDVADGAAEGQECVRSVQENRSAGASREGGGCGDQRDLRHCPASDRGAS